MAANRRLAHEGIVCVLSRRRCRASARASAATRSGSRVTRGRVASCSIPSIVVARARSCDGVPRRRAELVLAHVEAARVRASAALRIGSRLLDASPRVTAGRGRPPERSLSPEQATELALRAARRGDRDATGDPKARARSPRVAVDPGGNSRPADQVFRRDGDFWTIAYAGKEIRLRDLRGLHYLAALLREPNRELHATDLVRSGRGPSFDAGARRDARRRERTGRRRRASGRAGPRRLQGASR